MKLNVYDFIKKHVTSGHIKYCEAVIYPDGDIDYACPSHVKKLMDVYGKSEDEVWKEMPTYESPMNWLVSKTKCIAVWYNVCICPEQISKEQEKTLNELKRNKIIQMEVDL